MKASTRTSTGRAGAETWTWPVLALLCLSGCQQRGSAKGAGADPGRGSADMAQHKDGLDETPGPAVDCDLLARALRRCALQVAAAADPKLSRRTAAIPKNIRPSVLRGIKDGLVFRIVAPCRQHRGSMPQTADVKRCLETYRKAERAPGSTTEDPCRPLAECIRKLFRAAGGTPRPPPEGPSRPRPSSGTPTRPGAVPAARPGAVGSATPKPRPR